MSELRKADSDHPFFITMSIAGWIDLFTRERYCDIFINSLKYCIENKGLRVFEYVIMPSHVHLIAQHLESGLSDILRDLKSYIAKEFLKAIEEQGESRREWLLYMFHYFANGSRQNKEFMLWSKTIILLN